MNNGPMILPVMPTCSPLTGLSHPGSRGFGDGQMRLYDARNALKRELGPTANTSY